MYDIAENLANYHTFYEMQINTEIEKYLSVKRGYLKFAKKYYNKENRATLYYLPRKIKNMKKIILFHLIVR